MKYSEIKSIDEQWIDAEIQICTNELTMVAFKIMHDRQSLKQYWIDRKTLLETVKSKLISATSILQTTFDAGFDRGYAVSSDEGFGGGSNITEYTFEQFISQELQPVSTK